MFVCVPGGFPNPGRLRWAYPSCQCRQRLKPQVFIRKAKGTAPPVALGRFAAYIKVCVEPSFCWAVVAVAAACNVFLSLSLGALRSYSLARLEDLLESKPRRLESLHLLLNQEEQMVLGFTVLRGALMTVGMVATSGALIATTLSGVSVGEVGLQGWLITGLEATLLGLAVFVALGHTVPQAIGEGRAESVLLHLKLPLQGLARLCRPLTWFFGGLSTVFLRIFNIKEVDEKEEARDEILSAALAGENEGVIDEATKDVIENLMEFRDADVSEVMTPRIDIVSVNVADDLQTMLQIALKYERSRLPVIDGSVDKIVGILLVKDLLRAVSDTSCKVESLFRKPLFVPETKKVADLLKELRTQKVHMAIVADEYGGTAGLVTIEDLIEEIIGDIDDEHDIETIPIRRISESLVDADAKLRIDDLNEEFSIKIPEDEDVETLGGFISLCLGKIPAEGDRVELNGTSFEVTEADERRVTRVLITLSQ